MEEKLLTEKQKRIKNLVNNEGWGDVRQLFTEKILGLQTIAEVADLLETGSKEAVVEALKVNKKVAESLYVILAELEGTAQQAIENEAPEVGKSYIHIEP